jgi:hypothetical protein
MESKKKINEITNLESRNLYINPLNFSEKKVSKRPIIFKAKKNLIIKSRKISINEPIIFRKKGSPIKTIRYIGNDTGKIRHFTPAAQE